jgi:cytochrome bd ubiquinol oxidase subunit II
MLDYPTLKVIWWLLIGVLLIGFAVMDGHDLGVCTLLPFVGKSDIERRVVLNTVGPHWEGNQVWFITGGAALFAAWPVVYATAFSSFYWAMLAVLWALFFRPAGFDYRSKIEDAAWRGTWDWGLFIAGTVPPIVFGVAFGNLLQGVPFSFDSNMASTYTGSFWQLLNPFALLCGLVSSAMITLQGATYLAHRTEGAIHDRARWAARLFGVVLLVAFSAAGVWLASAIDGYVITSAIDPSAAANPIGKSVVRQAGAWLANYHRAPLTLALPALAYAGTLACVVLIGFGRTALAFLASSLAIIGVIGTAGASMFPFVMPSSSVPGASLTIWDGVSSHLTLAIMLVLTLVLMPIIILYTSWAYRVMAGKVTADYIRENEHGAY